MNYTQLIIAAEPSPPQVTPFLSVFKKTGAADAAGSPHVPRADSDSASSGTNTAAATSTSTGGSTTTRPFFQDPSSVTPSPAPNDGKSIVAKSVLEYVVLAVGLVVVACLVLRRYSRIRRNNEPLNRFFWINPRPSDHPHPAQPTRFPRTTGLSSVPPYPYARRVRAHDTDAAGRRIGSGMQVSDHDGYVGDKDVLPAYEYAGGPPKYGELLELRPRASYISRPPVDVGGVEGVSPGSRVEPPEPSISNDPAISRMERDVERGESIPTPEVAHLRT